MRTLVASLAFVATAVAQDLRPPSVPLVVHDPYFSIWSPHDRLTDGWPTHWTGRAVPMCAMVRVDGAAFRVMGPEPRDVPAMEQTALRVEPTTTVYEFATDAVAVTLRFVTPALPDDLDVLARPVTYLEWSFRSLDGTGHTIALHVDVSGVVAVDQPEQEVVGVPVPGMPAIGMASVEQPVLAKKGDDLRIDWGTAYLATSDSQARVDYGPAKSVRAAFVRGARRDGEGPDLSAHRADGRVAALCVDGRRVPSDQPLRLSAMVAYDDEWSIRYFGQDLRPYWRRGGMDGVGLLRAAARDEPDLLRRCAAFDRELRADLVRVGGEEWADLCALAYRQCLGANKLCADAAGRPLLFPKENFSNGCIATVDVIYPMAPLFLLLGADLAKAMLVPVLDYGSSERWRFPFAPHDLGTYPHATGQVYGGGEDNEQNQMPVEESANIILLVAAIAAREGDAGFAAAYWPTLGRWAAYLEQHGLDPVHQLCTDDFTGHLARNVNLSAKAVVALGAWAKLCAMRGLDDDAARWRAIADRFVPEWLRMADDGDHTRLAFDRPGTWSQKYNLVWDDLLGLGLFPAAAKAREVAHYRRVQNAYGLPLDSRATFTKIDWTAWSACLTGDRADFEALIAPLWRWADETPDRVPLCDWFQTKEPRKVNMIARPVVGGLFLRALCDAETWQRWFAKGVRGAAPWAEAPIVVHVALVPDARAARIEWRATTSAPRDGWQAPEFDDTAWSTGIGGYGTEGTPGARVGTRWDGPEIWLRRAFELDRVPDGSIELAIHHDEDAEVWVNGALAARLPGYVTSYVTVPLAPEARRALRAGRNVLSIHCRQTAGGQFVDAGLVIPRPAGTRKG